jgi:hypothetical protein
MGGNRFRLKPNLDTSQKEVNVRRWTEAEYEELFHERSPTEPHGPTGDECVAIGTSLRRTPGAIRAQWNDGRAVVLGQVSAASAGLRDHLVRRGWL